MKKLGFDLILLGDPTSGKDTQASILMKKYALKPVESGKHWRALAKKNNFEGRWLRRTMGLGYPTPVVLMKKFLVQNLNKRAKDKDLIFIGNPRLKPEAQLLVKLLKAQHRDFLVLYTKIPIQEILKRTKARPRLQTEAEGVRNRINYTKNQVSKTVKYFQGLGKLKFIDSTQPIPKVAKRIEQTIHDYQRSQAN